VGRPEAGTRFAADLRVFLAPRHRQGRRREAAAGGTRRTYQAFSRCGTSGRIYWRGAHSKRLVPIVESAIRAAAVTDRGCDQ
jgi:hypothetical protein